MARVRSLAFAKCRYHNKRTETERANINDFCFANIRCEMTTIGYARVSTDGQTLDAQQATLRLAGAEKVYSEKKTHLRDPFCPRNFFSYGGEVLCIKSAPSAIMAVSGVLAVFFVRLRKIISSLSSN
jgi:hypothetical protein